MKILSLFVITVTLLLPKISIAEGLESEIMSGSYCKMETFKRFKLIEKTTHTALKFAPSPKLLDFVTKMELMCPWSTQRDFNGDKKEDWIGFVEIEGQFQLIAYMSGIKNYHFIQIQQLKKKPVNHFIRWIQTKYLSHYSKNKLATKNLTYALQVADIEGMTAFYLWDGKTMKKILTTSQIF